MFRNIIKQMEIFRLIILLWVFAVTNKATPAATAQTALFSTKIFNEISKQHANENVIISPFSIKTCLGLAYMGAEGETSKELYNILELKGETKEQIGKEFQSYMQKVAKNTGVEFKSANRIYLADRYEIATKYNELIREYFSAQAEKINFSDSKAVDAINAWVADQTNQKIKQIVDAANYDDSVEAILINAIYFKATWKYEFEVSKTKEKDFHISNERSVPIKMMHLTAKLNYAELSDLDATAIEIPYAKSDIRMLIMLPNKIDGLPSLEVKMSDFDLTKINFSNSKVNLYLPKFKAEFSATLNGVLKNLGLTHMFVGGDFRNLTADKANLQVSNVNHKAFIEVDEKGTEAAAVTDIFMTRSFPGPRELSYDFIIDHPFFFVIKDDARIYFSGHIVKF